MAGILFAIIVVLALILGIGVPVAMGLYVYNDAKKRGMNALVWTLLTVIIPGFIGLIVYLIVRNEHSGKTCPVCGRNVSEHFSVCPGCGHSLKPVCPVCGKTVAYDWNICPHCANPIPDSIRVENPVKSKGDRGLKAIIAAVVIIPVLLGILLVTAVVFLFVKSDTPDYLNDEPYIEFETAELSEYAVVSVDISGYESIVKGAELTFYSGDRQLHATGTSIPEDQVYGKTIYLDFPVEQVSDSEYVVVTLFDADENVIMTSDKTELFDENGKIEKQIKLYAEDYSLVTVE